MRKTIFSIALISAVALMSCEKDETEKNIDEPKENFESLESFFESQEVESVTKTFNTEEGIEFTTDKGTVVTIPANAFTDKNGEIVSGEVDFKIKEVFSTSDIIFSEIFPISNGNPLNSGGEFFTEALQGGAALDLADGKDIELEIPAQAEDPNMELFFAGEEEFMDSVDWGDPMDTVLVWENDTNDQDWENEPWGNGFYSGFTFQDASGTYSINIDQLGWGNIDAFLWVDYFDITFTCTGLEGLNENNLTVYSIFKDQNTVWPCGEGWGSISDNVIHETHLADVPMNVLAIAVVDEQLYYGILDVTPEEGIDYDIVMKTTTSEKLEELINDLP